MRTLFAPVTVYTQPGCRACVRVIEKLADKGIAHDVVNLDNNPEAKTYVTEVLNAASVPVIVTDTHEPIIGYHPEKVADLIAYYTASETGL
ncbi:NrdH-like glutaredoxin [Mycobacterium phage DarthPhader]|uniref:NrdH-like glutaredoxin n=1 Tax=Mycobacterium phage DarthPhader TaxID=1912975 RepID=A0A1I9S400_9CAUD|nr:NrdH-like glutaredoxin [Mycobacterium phage DarthPhader]AOZ61294.1 NrdH-like glutaredoxin [Mycobacterium phage DarthPhader]